MKQTVTVQIDGSEYKIVTDKDPKGVYQAASLVDKILTAIRADSSISRADSAILAALNIADLYYEDRSVCDNLRVQIRSYADECAALRSELNKIKEAKKE